MDDLVLIPKKPAVEALEGRRTGRKPRQSFGIRSYDGGTSVVLVVPAFAILHPETDKAEFYANSKGFAIRLASDGDRAISQRKNARTIHVPQEIKSHIPITSNGTTDLHCEERDDRVFFFPYSQFGA